MICLILENSPNSLNGELRRYLFEIKKGVFFGNISARVRDLLWVKISEQKNIKATLVYSSNTEQGFEVKVIGEPNRVILDEDGVYTVMKKENFDLNKLKAKTNTKKNLFSHLIETSVVTKQLLKVGRLNHIYHVLQEKLSCSEDDLINFLCFISALHDVGKIHPSFQLSIENNIVKDFFPKYNKIEHFRHEVYGQNIIKEYLEKRIKNNQYESDEKEDNYAIHINIIPKVIGLHHLGKKITHDSYKLSDSWINIQKEVIDKLYDFYPVDFDKIKISKKEENGIGVLLTAIVNLSDWIASSDGVFDEKELDDFDDKNKYIEHLDNQVIKFLNKNYLIHRPLSEQFAKDKEFVINKENPYSELFDISTPREMQSKLIKICNDINPNSSSLIFIEDVCGGGKTEGSLYTAISLGQNMGGIIDCLPTSATSEQLQTRIESMYKHFDKDFKLPTYNSRAWLSDKDNNLDKQLWLHPSRLKLLYPSAVATVDQAIMATQSIKYGLIRLLGFSDKAIIIDEMHAYDRYMLEFLKVLLEYCGWLKIPVIILSATLPTETKLDLIKSYIHDKNNENIKIENLSNSYPLITVVNKDNGNLKLEYEEFSSCFNKKYPYRFEAVLRESKDLTSQSLEIKNLAIKQVSEGGCLDIILNTVAEAQDLYNTIKKSKESCEYDGELYLIHARFSENKKEKDAMKILELFGKDGKNKGLRPKKAIVISTQILEQSLDVDFDFTFSEICPIDLLIQRIGRQRRHDDRQTIRYNAKDEIKYSPTIILIKQESDKHIPSEEIYEEEILNKTLNELNKKPNKVICIPEDVRSLIDNVYSKNNENSNPYCNGRQIHEKKQILSSHAKAIEGPYKRKFSYYDGNVKNQLKNQIPTRYEDDYQTISIAFLPNDIYEHCCDIKESNLDINLELCKDIIKNHTYSIGKNYIEDKQYRKVLLDASDYIGPDNKMGYLHGTYLLRLDENNMVVGKKYKFIVDEELGLVVNKLN